MAMDPGDIEARLKGVPGWKLQDGALERSLAFKDFTEAFSFMAAVALVAEKAGHHPDWSNSYNRVDIRLTSHEAGGVTDKDFLLATRIDEIAGPDKNER